MALPLRQGNFDAVETWHPQRMDIRKAVRAEHPHRMGLLDAVKIVPPQQMRATDAVRTGQQQRMGISYAVKAAPPHLLQVLNQATCDDTATQNTDLEGAYPPANS